MMEHLLKISQQTLWQILGKIVTSLSTFIILGMVARNYGEEGTGVFTLALTYLAIFYLLSDFGLNAHILRKIRNPKFEIRNEFRRLLGTRILWSAFLAILAVGLLPLWPFSTPAFSQSVLFGSLAILGSAIFVTCNLIFQSKLRYDLSIISSSAGALIGLVFFWWVVSNLLTVPQLMLAHLLSWIIIAVTSLLLVKNFLPNLLPIYQFSYLINLFKSSWPIAATLALNVVYFRADSFMISIFRSNSEVGIYNVAYAVFQTALVLPTFIMNSYYPLMLKSFSGIKFVGLSLLGLASLGTLIILIIAPFLIQILTGGEFFGSTQSLQILSLGFPAYFLSALLMWVMVAKGAYKVMLTIYAIGLGLNLLLNLIYIPQYSFIAASYVTVISEYLILGMQLVSLRLIK